MRKIYKCRNGCHVMDAESTPECPRCGSSMLQVGEDNNDNRQSMIDAQQPEYAGQSLGNKEAYSSMSKADMGKAFKHIYKNKTI